MLIFQRKLLLILPALILAGLFTNSLPLQAQSFKEGLRYYKQQNYVRAVSIFNQINTPEAYLFTGKSFYAMGRYRQAQSTLNNIGSDAPPAIISETIYTSALVDFQLNQFGEALNKLYQIYTGDTPASLRRDANSLYRGILNYLTAQQRIDAIKVVSNDEIRFDLLESGLGKVSYDEARQIFDESESAVDEDEWSEKVEAIANDLSSARRYRNKFQQSSNKLRAPEGTIYNIGVALPQYQAKDREFDIVRSIYFGAMLAAEQFNRNSRNARASVRFVNTGTSDDTLRSAIEQFAENERGAALIGPLFSEQAETMVPLVTNLKIPAIAPLANSRLNAADSYLFQSNPTFAMHGREMARYAVRELQMERFAVLASRETSGAVSAEAFRDEAEQLGAEIVHYFIDDLKPNDYDVSEYTRYFGSETEPVEAVYAPFTGQAALTLIDLLISDVRVMYDIPALLGSQEWQRLDFSSTKYDELNIHFSQGYYPIESNAQFSRFSSRYQRQFSLQPDQFAMIGYDIASFLLNTLDEVANPALLKSSIYKQPLYRGLVNDIRFDEDTNTNRAIKIIEVTGAGGLKIKN